MTDIRKIHREAMELAREANEALKRNEADSYNVLIKKAFDKEKTAAIELTDHLEAEPTRGVLFRSAANLAISAGYWKEAKELIETGLAGKPFPEIQAELKQLLEKVEEKTIVKRNWERVLETRSNAVAES